MQSKLGLFLCLLVALNVASTTLTKRPRILTTDYVTKSGNITINKDYYGYYVNADLSYNYNDASDSEGYDNYIAQMSLGLYTSQTLFSNYCLDFEYYYCSSYGCYEYTSEIETPSFPDFSVLTGYAASANLYLDYTNWELRSDAIIASSCDDYTYSGYGTNRFGILGLGVNGSYSNFLNNSMFSISLARDGSTGTLLFWSNSDMTSSDNYVGQLSSTEDWQIAPSYATITVNSDMLSAYVGVIFDLNSNGIALPTSLYNDIIEDLEDLAPGGMSCSGQYYQPLCYYQGYISDLPTITITVQGVDITLPPTLYVLDESDEDTYVYDITLNFRLIDPSYSGYNYVSDAYQNYIILDSSFMSYYYTEFSYNYGSPTITLYSQYQNPSSSNVTWPYIVGGILGFIIIFSFIGCCIKRRKMRLQQQSTRGLIVVSDQTPLTNNVYANVPYPAQPQTYPQYDQGGYGYGYYQQNNPAPYGKYDNNNSQPGAYNYLPPQQGQFYGN